MKFHFLGNTKGCLIRHGSSLIHGKLYLGEANKFFHFPCFFFFPSRCVATFLTVCKVFSFFFVVFFFRFHAT